MREDALREGLAKMRKQTKYVIKFGRVPLPRSKYHTTKKGIKGYLRAQAKRDERKEREQGR